MIAEKKIVEIATQLLDRTKEGKVIWEPETGPDPNRGKPTFTSSVAQFGVQVELQESTIHLVRFSPPTKPDYIRFELTKKDGQPVAILNSEDGDEHWDLFDQLGREASRVAYDWDEVLGDVEKALRSDAVIGQGITALPAAFRDKLVGDWTLTYTQVGREPRTESVRIEADATYRVDGKPKFKLVDIEFDAQSDAIEFTKRYMDGEYIFRPQKDHHREVLRFLGSDRMEGHRKGEPRHKLVYVRK